MTGDQTGCCKDRLGVVAVLAAGVFVLALSWFKLASVDIGYHVAYGGWFLDHGRIVDSDPFLLPAVRKSFVNANWGSQVVMALAFRAGGAGGLIALRVLLIAFIFGTMAWIVRRATGRWRPVAWAWLVAGWAAYERFTMRPELLSYAIMLAMLAVLAVLHRGSLSRRGIAALAVLQLVWVNVHSYFLVGLMLTGAYVAAAWARALLQGEGAGAAEVRRLARLLSAALAIQILVCFINPWGHRGALFPFTALQSLESGGILGSTPEQAAIDNPWSLISEFHSPWSHVGMRAASRTLSGYLVLILLAAGAAIVAVRRGRWAELLFLAILFAMSWQMRRNIAQFALAGAPISVCLICTASASRGAIILGIRRSLSVAACIVVIACGLFWTAGIVDGRFYFAERRLTREFGAGFSNRAFANDAAAWLASQSDVEEGLFVNYNASSNVLPALEGRFKLLVDTNTFAYQEETLSAAQRLGQGSTKYTETLDILGLSSVFIHCGADADGLAWQLAGDYTEWALVYFDRQAVIFVRRIPRHVPLIAANRVDAGRLDPQAWIASMPGGGIQRAIELASAADVPLVLGWADKAAPLLQEAVRLAPDYDEAWVNLGKCFGIRANRARVEGRTADQAAADLQEAIRCFERARSINPQLAEAAANLQKARQSLESLFAPAARPPGAG